MTVHFLKHGLAMCGVGMPSSWPEGDKWVSFEDDAHRAEVTCPGCLAAESANAHNKLRDEVFDDGPPDIRHVDEKRRRQLVGNPPLRSDSTFEQTKTDPRESIREPGKPPPKWPRLNLNTTLVEEYEDHDGTKYPPFYNSRISCSEVDLFVTHDKPDPYESGIGPYEPEHGTGLVFHVNDDEFDLDEARQLHHELGLLLDIWRDK